MYRPGFRVIRLNKSGLIAVYIVAVVALLSFWIYIRIPSNYIQVPATVVSTSKEFGGVATKETLSFTAKNDQKVTFTWNDWESTDLTKGSSTTAYYNPANPKQAKGKTTSTDYIGIVIATVVVLALLTFWSLHPNKVTNKNKNKKR